MWRSKLKWQHTCCALALTGALIGTANTEVVAAPRADWCYNECGPEATCETECENDGGGTITCGDYHDGAPEWCNADNCNQVCWQNSPPSQECIWENQSTTCYDYGVYGYCGDNVCSGITLGETCTNCEDDCLVCPSPIECDNEICESGETFVTCPEDCVDPGSSGYCGDGICSALDGEDEDTCYDDCVMPNERCEDDFDCGPGYTCAAGGEPMGGQCVMTDKVWTLAACIGTGPTACNHVGSGFVCREVSGSTQPRCIWWYDLQ